MLEAVRCWQWWTRFLSVGVVVAVLGLTGCGGRSLDIVSPPPKVTETAPPQVIQVLSNRLAATAPSVEIVSPLDDTVLDQDQISVKFQVEGMPVFRDETLGLGLHLNVLLDNQFYQSVYDVTEPLLINNITPGSHTIRAIATLPWEESFKNPAAQAQTTIHIFAKTPATVPDTALPVLTYHQPTGNYSAEPILLDYLLAPGTIGLPRKNTTAIAPETATWQIRATVNGESFDFKLLEPIYLKGFEAGKNWVQLELLDASGVPIDSLFNNTIRLINYQPGGEDTLSQLMRDEVTVDDVAQIIDPTYQTGSLDRSNLESIDISTPQSSEATEVQEETALPEVKAVTPEIPEADLTPLDGAEPVAFDANMTDSEILEVTDDGTLDDGALDSHLLNITETREDSDTGIT